MPPVRLTGRVNPSCHFVNSGPICPFTTQYVTRNTARA